MKQTTTKLIQDLFRNMAIIQLIALTKRFEEIGFWLISIYPPLTKKQQGRFYFGRFVLTHLGIDRIPSFPLDVWLLPT